MVSWRSSFCFAVCLVVIFCAHAATAASAASLKTHKHVTCGSVVKLEHVQSKFRLHSHDVKYGSGSGQQSVTGYPGSQDPNSYWRVWGPQCASGMVIKNGQVLTMEHVQTRKFLHSHLHQSPLSGNQEVSAYDGRDTGDLWRLKVVDGSDGWRRDSVVQFEHVDTNLMLATNARMKFGDPIRGQQEIYCNADKGRDSHWTAQEGVYMPENV